MITTQEQPQQSPDNQAPLTPLADFRKSGRAPVEMHHLIFHNKKSLVEFGAICKFGRKWLLVKADYSNGYESKELMLGDLNVLTNKLQQIIL